MSHLPTVWLKENQVRLVGSSRSFTCNYSFPSCFRHCVPLVSRDLPFVSGLVSLLVGLLSVSFCLPSCLLLVGYRVRLVSLLSPFVSFCFLCCLRRAQQPRAGRHIERIARQRWTPQSRAGGRM